MNNIKIVFVDIDWTILDHASHSFDMESLNALKEAQRKGIKIVIATARPYLSAEDTGLFNLITPDGIICTNGSVAFFNDELLYSQNMPHEIVKKVIKVANKHNAVLEYTDEKKRYFTRKPNRYVYKYFESYSETVPPVKAFEKENVSALLLLVPESYDEVVKKELPTEIEYSRFDPYGVDLRYFPFSPHKGIGVKAVLEHLGLKKENAMAIGDDYADIAMFNEVGISVALGNAKEGVKQIASFVTKKVSESGVKHALKYYKVI